jgi:hypothetical protein
MEQSDNSRPVANLEEEAQEERKRYITRLQRRAQSQISSDLGSDVPRSHDENQIATLIQQVLQETSARRVTIFRPIARGQRWHAATALADGGLYFSLVPPESVVLPMAVFTQRRSLVWNGVSRHEIPQPRPDEFGYRSYVGAPLLSGGEVVAIVEAVDFAQADQVERHLSVVETRLSSLGKVETADSPRTSTQTVSPAPAASTHGLTEETVLDLVLRPSMEPDEVIEIAPQEWMLINQLNGERPLAETASAAGLPTQQAISVAALLLERGLIKIGRENRRRG